MVIKHELYDSASQNLAAVNCRMFIDEDSVNIQDKRKEIQKVIDLYSLSTLESGE